VSPFPRSGCRRRGRRDLPLLVLQATMRTVQDIVNNLLNNLQLLRVDTGIDYQASLSREPCLRKAGG
jgi:hypothetical protein